MRPMPAPLGLYIHIPFCKSKCVYCDFYSLPRSESRMDDYTDALCAHLAETAPFAAGHLVDTVYFGGGTPSYLGTKRLVKILKTILKKIQGGQAGGDHPGGQSRLRRGLERAAHPAPVRVQPPLPGNAVRR